MLGSIDDTDKKRIEAVFAARYQAEEDHKLTIQGYGETFKEIATKLGMENVAITKAYSDYKFSMLKPEVISDRDSLTELVFNE